MTFTKEQLIAAACSRIDFAKQMLRGNPLPLAKRKWEIELSLSEISLASLEAEPVAWRYRHHNGLAPSIWKVVDSEDECNMAPNYQRQALYTAPPAPVVPDNRAITQHFDTIALDTAKMIMCDVGRRHEFCGGDLQLLSRIQCRIDEACRAAMLQGKAEPRQAVRSEHAEWSKSTFGDVGPVGPLKHLSKDALEAAAEPDDLSEWADMQFLLWDAQRRAGITDEQITEAMIDKLAVNKARIWPEPKDGEPRLHIKAAPRQEVK